MRIIKEGTIDNRNIITLICPICACMYETDSSEYRVQYDVNGNFCYSSYCPMCRNGHFQKMDDICDLL